MDFVTVVNRTSKPLEAIWDGVRRTFEPGETPNTPKGMAEAARRQHVIMGTADPYEMAVADYLIAIKELNQDCSPVEQTDSVERWDRTLVPGGQRAVEIRKGRGGSYQSRDPLSTISGFDSPKS